MSEVTLDTDALSRVLALFREGLERHEAIINSLNVYPVPDGDTGTNMLRTVQSAERHVREDGVDPTTVLGAIGRGALLGARGNSGVILSQILRGLVGAADPGRPFDATSLAAAFGDASAAARAAVLRPVEGTMLTVADDAARAAADELARGGDLPAVATAARDGARTGLERTPDLLPVLASAGVVDAGGAGLTQLFEAFVAEATGTAMPSELTLPAEVVALLRTGGAPSSHAAAAPSSVGDLRYEVMFLLDAADDRIDELKRTWGDLGDSIVVVGGEGTYNCHIHTDAIGAAIEAGITAGRPSEIRVTDLFEQMGAEAIHGGGAIDENPRDAHRHPAVSGVVAVASGAGVAAILRSLGAEEIVAGGQSMNPSTEELLQGIGAAVSREVVVLPNNSNVIPVALEAAKLAGRAVAVVPTRSVQEGIAALIAYDPGATADANVGRMAAAARGVVSGEVTRAARDASTAVGEVRAGDWIGVGADGVIATASSCAEAAVRLVAQLVTDGHELLTVIEGADAPDGELQLFLDAIADRFPALDVEHHQGGQPVYPILLSLE